ncbi:class I SAM-dependent methyltransferase [Clostridium hydrogenum]|uniref:class I SAM-dependent methyltransferase n=1 Tax=Clostridium hydrogenum TaxID=2855764 RepID=UPI001F2D0688|nr:class I SAM-dependent methyltransferase [Clostridium hydrogenum]
MEYYGIFKQINELSISDISKIDFYEGFFAEFYESQSNVTNNEEVGIYLKNAYTTGGNVLELACGNGRITLQLARRGIKVIGVDNSKDMLKILDKKVRKSDLSVKKNIVWYNQDVLNLDIKEEFSLAIIPATTICLLFDDIEKTAAMFNYIYDKLPIGGRLVFDYISEYKNQENKTPIEMVTNESEGIKEFIMWQEFKNFDQGRAIMNFYAERIENNTTFRYLGCTNKKIISGMELNNLISKTKFKQVETIVIENNLIGKVKYVVLEK